MNYEESRLRTFHNWPTTAEVEPARIARAGFFSTGRGLEVQCFRCGGRISEWSFGDQVMARHRRLDPACPFVLEPTSSGNVPLSGAPQPPAPAPAAPTTPTTSAEELLTKDSIYKIDVLRLISFTDWPVSFISRESLALAGFYYVREPGGAGDRVRCAWCGGELQNWAPGDVPLSEHLRHFPNCSYAKAKSRANSLSARDNEQLVNSGGSIELGIQAACGTGEPTALHTLESRVRSFTQGWPSELPQQPADLAAAGFHYVGPGDQVRCFQCGGGLCHWLAEDDPWEEHARWFPSCSFLLLVKGKQFVDRCKRSSSSSNGGARVAVTDEEVERCMSSPAALAALSCGLQAERVRRAIRTRLQDAGLPFPSTDSLIDAALNEQLSETPFPAPTPVAPLPPGTPPTVEHVVQSIRSEERDAGMVTRGEESPVAGSPAKPQELTLEEENRQLKEARLCKVCMDAEVGVVLLPCGHLLSCVQCAPCLPACPLCRSKVKGVVRTYLC